MKSEITNEEQQTGQWRGVGAGEDTDFTKRKGTTRRREFKKPRSAENREATPIENGKHIKGNRKTTCVPNANELK